MDSIFNLEEAERSSFLGKIIESSGFAYVCLWSHFPKHSNCLIFTDGVYKEENNQPNSSSSSSSSSGSLAMRSFLDYQNSVFLIDNCSRRVPGFAFMHNLAYMEITGLELLELASSSSQLQFYQEARIKTAIFMGCKNGEIEVGMCNGSSQVNNELELKKLFLGDFPQEVLPQQRDQAQARASSCVRPLPMENNVDYPSFLFNMLHTSSYTPEVSSFHEPFSHHQTPNQSPSCSTMRSKDPLQQALIQIRTNHLIPSREYEEAAITRAILAAISSSSSPSPPSFSSFSHQHQAPRAASAFKRYRTHLGPIKRTLDRQNLNRRSLLFYRSLSEARPRQEDLMVQYTTRPPSNQLHHMISERKRREKLNKNFQALRSLLPPGSKKDKTSVLSNIKEYIASLKSQVEEVNERNKILEADHYHQHSTKQILIPGERLKVQIMDVDGSTSSDSRAVDLEVNVRGNLILSDLVVRVIEFLKNQVENVTVTSLDAGTRMLETQVTMNRVVLRLTIQGSEWNRSSFQEALSRVLDDLAE